MKQLLVLGVVALFVGLVTTGPALAGGWAVATLDSVPEPTAHKTVEIGFTIRQHGVAPVNPDGEVGIVLRSGDVERFFPAEPVGEDGHYLAEVTFGHEGVWSWAVRQGWFPDQTLGTIDVAGPEPLAPAAAYRGPEWIRFGLPALAILLGAAAIVDLGRSRRRQALAG